MTDDFAPPPAPDGIPAGAVRRADFRPPAPVRRRGRFPRWVAVVLGLGVAAIAIGVAAQVALTIRDDNVTPASAGTTGRLHSGQVVVGMCIEKLGDSAGPVHVVPCDQPHAAEAVTSYAFTGDDWPGAEHASRTVLAYCASQLAPGGPLGSVAEGRDWVAWVPSEETWRHGDRIGLCIVTADSPWTGSAKG